MDAKELKNKLNPEQIKIILESLGGVIWYEDDEKIILNTICHGGDSPNKLYYIKDGNYFFCYTHCGQTDIFAIVSEVKDFNLPQSINYICTLLGISQMKEGFGKEESVLLDDWTFINSYKRKYEKINKIDKECEVLDENTLNMFQKIYSDDWVKDGISLEVMEKYNILYSTLKQSIIIPHYNVENKLIGIRQRATIQEDIDCFGKYTPFSICGDMYNHPLSTNLYGLNRNKDCIKRTKKVMIVESEKGALQAATMFGVDNNFTVALCGCSKISKIQRQLLQDLGVVEVIIALDRQYEKVGSEEYKKWRDHITNKIINPLLPYFNVSVIWDTEGLLGYKDSPTDRGKEVLLKLMKSKIKISG